MSLSTYQKETVQNSFLFLEIWQNQTFLDISKYFLRQNKFKNCFYQTKCKITIN